MAGRVCVCSACILFVLLLHTKSILALFMKLLCPPVQCGLACAEGSDCEDVWY